MITYQLKLADIFVLPVHISETRGLFQVLEELNQSDHILLCPLDVGVKFSYSSLESKPLIAFPNMPQCLNS